MDVSAGEEALHAPSSFGGRFFFFVTRFPTSTSPFPFRVTRILKQCLEAARNTADLESDLMMCSLPVPQPGSASVVFPC